MMGRLSHDQEQFFYSFRLDEAVSDDHPVREIAAVLDLSWVHSELARYYSRLGRPSIDPVLLIRMLFGGFGFVGSRLKTRSPITRRFHGLAMSGSAIATSSVVFSSVLWVRASGRAWSAARAS